MLSSPLCRFPSDLLLTSSSGELWRMVRIGGQPLGFGECRHHPRSARGGMRGFGDPLLHHRCASPCWWHRGLVASPDECGIVAQIAEPLAAVDISAYYISTFNFDHALVSPARGATASPPLPVGLTDLCPRRSLRRASRRSSSCCRSARRAADSGQVRGDATPVPSCAGLSPARCSLLLIPMPFPGVGQSPVAQHHSARGGRGGMLL